MHSRGWDRIGTSRIVQGNHLPGRPQGIYQACDSWDFTTTTWLGPGFCCPLAAVWGEYIAWAQILISVAPPIFLFRVLTYLRVALSLPPCTLPSFTCGRGKPFRVFPGVHP